MPENCHAFRKIELISFNSRGYTNNRIFPNVQYSFVAPNRYYYIRYMAHSDGLVRSGEVNQFTKLLFILEFKILQSQVIDLIFGTVWK